MTTPAVQSIAARAAEQRASMKSVADTSMRWGKGYSRTIHLSRGVVIGGIERTLCNAPAGHCFSTGAFYFEDRQVFGTGHIKLCKRCFHPNQAAVLDGVIAFVCWARSLSADSAVLAVLGAIAGGGA